MAGTAKKTTAPATERALDRAAVQKAQSEAGAHLEQERQARIGARDGHPSLERALVAFQAEMPKVAKTKTAKIPGKNGGPGYSYKYADLADVSDTATPLLARHGLSFTCVPAYLEGAGFVLKGVLRHESGGYDEGVLPITGREAQALGSSITYLRRYLLGCMTGIVTDEDEDGTIAQAQKQQRPESDVDTSHVASVREQIGALDEESKRELQRRWTAVGNLPGIDRLNPAQAKVVEGLIDSIVKEAAQ
jgi:hypothetical protein